MCRVVIYYDVAIISHLKVTQGLSDTRLAAERAEMSGEGGGNIR